MITVQFKDQREFDAMIAGFAALELLITRYRMRGGDGPFPPLIVAVSGHAVKDLIALAEKHEDRLTIEEINGLVERINSGIELCKGCGTEINPATNLGFDVCADCAKIQDSKNQDLRYTWEEEDGDWDSWYRHNLAAMQRLERTLRRLGK
jgi:hypothetical protein